MNIPALHTNIRALPQTFSGSHLDVEPMSRPDAPANEVRCYKHHVLPADGVTSTMSYPQRIKLMIARAPAPPPLRRVAQAARPLMSEETRALLLYVHTVHATFGTPTSAQTH